MTYLNDLGYVLTVTSWQGVVEDYTAPALRLVGLAYYLQAFVEFLQAFVEFGSQDHVAG